jgi:hypothetical protein
VSEVTIRRVGTDAPTLTLELLGSDELSGGDGVWTSSERYARTPMTTWEGTTSLVWTLPLSLDSFDDGRSVERRIATLDSWRRPSDSSEKPPVLRVDAPLGRAPANTRWVITSIEWGDEIRDASGQRIRQDLRITFLEYEPGQIAKGPAAKSRDNAKRHKWVPTSAQNRRCKVCKRPRDDKRHTNRT